MRIDPKEGSPAMDYTEHMKTYGLFCKLTAYTILGVIAVMAAPRPVCGLIGQIHRLAAVSAAPFSPDIFPHRRFCPAPPFKPLGSP